MVSVQPLTRRRKTRFVLMPHIHGWAHRVRCDLIASELLASNRSASVILTLRRDDPTPATAWTALPTTRSRFGRTWSILRASVLIRDGISTVDFRVHLLKRLGGKLVLILQPTGFPHDPRVRDALEAADLILVPYPEKLLRLEPPLLEFAAKVRVIPPILNMGHIPRTPPSDRLVIYCSVARPEAKLREVLGEAESILSTGLGRRVEIRGGLGRFQSDEEHAEGLSQAHVVITQGATAAFEALHLGIPVIVIPRADSPEQIMVSESLAREGLAKSFALNGLSPEALAEAVRQEILQEPRPQTVFVKDTGLREATNLVSKIGGLPGVPKGKPWLSIVATNYDCAHALDAHLTSLYRQFLESEFEYVVVDNMSDDGSPSILERWASNHRNFSYISTPCSRGGGREIAAGHSQGRFLLVVDTDTAYFPALRTFVLRAVAEWPRHAVQAIHAGVLPTFLWRAVGGWRDFNIAEDFDLWMRLQRLGRIRWYPVRMGENLKESYATDAHDYLSSRYDRIEKLMRLFRTHYDFLRLSQYEKKLDLHEIWKQGSVDFGLGTVETAWFGESGRGTLKDRAIAFGRAAIHILAS